MKRYLPTALLAASLLGPTPALAADGGETAFVPLRDQGRHYLRRKLYPVALLSLERAITLPGGQEDFRTNYYLAETYDGLLMPERAFPAAELAAELATGEMEEVRSQRLLERLRRRFGAVELAQAADQKTEVRSGIIHLERTGGDLKPGPEEVFHRIRARLVKTPVELPLTIYLPNGSYLANRAPFDVVCGETTEAETYLVPADAGAGAWWLLAGGSLVAAAAATTAAVLLLPAYDR